MKRFWRVLCDGKQSGVTDSDYTTYADAVHAARMYAATQPDSTVFVLVALTGFHVAPAKVKAWPLTD